MSDHPDHHDFELSELDKASHLWRRLKAHFEASLATARLRNDNATHSEPATAMLRGEIACLKKLLRLDVPRILTPPGE